MISVVIPSYNEEKNIPACLKSLSDQTIGRDEYEIIVVDGNSKDRTREIAAEYADMVFIQTSRKVGVPCITYGPGGRTHPDAKGLMHAVGEHVHVDDLVTAAKVYLDAALELCSRSATTQGAP